MAVFGRGMPAGWAVLGLLLSAWYLSPDVVRGGSRERALDLLLPLLAAPAPSASDVVIVDIDRVALGRFGPWPWPRAQLARLVAAVAAARPLVLGLDILLAGPDRFSPTAIVDALPDGAARIKVAGLVATLPDGDALLAGALGTTTATLGFVLDTNSSEHDLPTTPILLDASAQLPGFWHADGVAGPSRTLLAAAQGLGALVAAADADGPIRRVPLLVLSRGTLRPGLAVEVVRLAQGAAALLIDGEGSLHIGDLTVPLGRDAQLRLVQRAPADWAVHTVGATQVLDDAGVQKKLSGKIVLIGSSAPELGGLRATPAFPATPSVQIQAEAIDTLMRGAVAWRPAWLDLGEVACAAVLGLLGLWLAARLRPAAAAALVVLVCLAWVAAAAAAARELSWLVDPVGPTVITLASFAAASLARFARDEWRGRLLLASFEQHLAPDVVRRIAADPTALRLRGEMREITALFSDIEDFTSMTERADPADLVALLDAYFDAAGRIVTEHGGMIEKIVGDSVHAVFNVPFDLDDHPQRAVACALALLDASEDVRSSQLGQRLQLGRTRIGIETGQAIVGDIGGSRKLDYTAHGSAMNRAARLEVANKDLGSSICIGPGTAARLPPGTLRSIGTVDVRGQGQVVEVFTPVAPRCAAPA